VHHTSSPVLNEVTRERYLREFLYIALVTQVRIKSEAPPIATGDASIYNFVILKDLGKAGIQSEISTHYNLNTLHLNFCF